MARWLEDLASQLPPPGKKRLLVVAALLVGALVASGLTALIIVFMITALRS